MRSRGRREKKRSRSRSGRSRRGWRRDEDRRLSERGQQGMTGEAGGRERRLEAAVALNPAVPGSLAAEDGETGRGRRRTSGVPRVEAAQTEMTDAVTLPVVVLPGVVHLHPRRVAALGGERDRTGQTGHHPDVTGDSRGREAGDRVDLLGVAEISVTEDLHQDEMVVMLPQDALRTVMFGDEVDQLVVPIGLHPAEVEVDVIVTLEDLEEADVIATLVGVVTMPDLEMMVPLTGVKVRLVAENGDLHPEMSDLVRTD